MLQNSLARQGNILFKYRSYLPLLILAAGLALFVHSVKNDNLPGWIPYHCIEYSSVLVSLLGLLIRILAVGFTPANTSGRNTKTQLADELNSTGIYSVVRHPLYLGNFFMWLGSVMLVGHGWFMLVFVLAYWIYYERIMYAEEQFLAAKFGKSYIDWANCTPAFFPALKKPVLPAYPFSVRKVLKKEKNGVFAIFTLLFVFHNIAFSLQQKKLSVENNWILWMLLITGVGYLILKFIKKYSTLLDEKGR